MTVPANPRNVKCRSRYSVNKRLALGCAVLLLLTCMVSQTWHPSYGHFNTKAPDTDVVLQWPIAGSYSMSLDVKVLKSPLSNAAIYWGQQYQFANNETGYITLGVGGNSKVTSFGIFDAIQGSPNNSSGVCDNVIGFLTTGTGSACFIFYNWNIGYDYRLQVSRISDINGSEQWQGSIYDYSANSTSIIGNILVSPTYGQLGTLSSTWDEYATASSCDTPPSSAIISSPYSLNAAGNHAPSKAEVTYGNTTCQDSNVQYLGGGAYQADAGSNVTRTTPAKTWLWMQEPTLTAQSQTSLPVPEFTSIEPVFLAVVMISAVAAPALIHRADSPSHD
ncbi:MAG: hypothetical protein ABSD99_06525 [Candidatus Bathyarchaeia archaeon]